MDKTYRDNFLKAGEIAGQVRTYGLSLIKTGASYNDVIKKIIAKIHELGGEPAFPPQMAMNECAAHFLPDPQEDVIFTDQLVSLDVGIHVDGAIGDCAGTIDLTEDKRHQHLIDASRECLLAALQTVKVGVTTGQIGAAINEAAQKRGLQSIRNLSGHGLGEYVVHTKPSIPNFDTQSQTTIEPGMTIAIEPFVTEGEGLIYDAGNPMIYSFDQKRPVRSQITKDVVKEIMKKNGLPFSMHELISTKNTYGKVKYALNELVRIGAIQGYAPLVEKAKGMVAQSENTVLIDDDGTVIITTEPDCLLKK